MNTNRRKGKKTEVTRSDLYENFQCYGGNCSYSKNNYELDDIRSKSRIRIVGQLGLTNDDEYVMNCGATVNDTPIKTNVMHLDDDDNFDQEEYDDDYHDFKPMITQSTQVNFNLPKAFPKKDLKNQTAQCSCEVTRPINLEMCIPKSEPENIEIEHCNSPFVVISVYPREDKFENNYTITKTAKQLKQRGENNNFKNPSQRSNPLLRPSSPRSSSSRRKEALNIRNNERKIRSRSTSPALDNATKSKNKMIDRKVNNTLNNQTKKLSPLRNRSPDKSVHKLIDAKRGNKSKQQTNYINDKKNYSRKTNLKQQRDVRETNKEQVKRAIVNTFLNNVDRTDGNCFNHKIFDPRKDASRVTINIDGGKEKYDVFFEQQNYDTGLTVRKTVNPQSSFKINNNKPNKTYENIPLISDFPDEYIANRKEKNSQHPSKVPKLMATESRLNVKDSLEISHRREGRKSSQQETKQTTGGTNDNNCSRHPEVIPMKHYRGDNCLILDPNERDKEIRELLGILRGKRPQVRKETEIDHPEKQDIAISCHIECAQRLLTELSLANLFPRKPRKPRKLKEKCPGYAKEKHDNIKNLILHSDDTDHIYKSNEIKYEVGQLNCDINNITKDLVNAEVNFPINKTNKELCLPEKSFLNRNIQVFLQIDQSMEQKPIRLTKRQYDKVKNTIKRTISKKSSLEKRKHNNVKKCNVLSIGEIKIRSKVPCPKYFEREIQTRKELEFQQSLKNIKTQNEHVSNSRLMNTYAGKKSYIQNDLCRQEKNIKKSKYTRRIASSVGVQYASVAFFKNMSVSSTQLGIDKKESLQLREQHYSLHTIFKGHRKMPTPNLGTSIVSIDSNNTNESNNHIKSQLCSGDGNTKKPFLRRLISCLVMRSGETSELKNAFKKKASLTRKSSIDSYHISTSLGAIEMTSSLYDTSASFFSHHTVYPVHKRKRSFFSSVREFLTNKRI